MLGTWNRIYDGGDLEAVVRSSTLVSTPDDSSSSNKDLLTRSECLIKNGVTQSKNRDLPLKNDEGRPTILSIPQVNIAATSDISSASPNKVEISNLGTVKVEANGNSNSDTVKIEPRVNCLTRLTGIRRRKSQQRRIMCVPAAGGPWNKHGGGGVPSDLWAWRKYGQKPIKGSPYPRGYYRCSSSKGCPARKQIERSHSDPTLLVITYTAEHNHAWPASRNALGRSSRQIAFRDKNNDDDNNNAHELSTPNAAQLHQSPPDVSPSTSQTQIQSQSYSEGKIELSCAKKEDDCVGIDQDLGFRADHGLFSSLVELPELYPQDFTIHSDEEAASTVIDPFNLFNWPPLVNNASNF